ncbi:MAG: DUF4160 domain-containing protein [Bacteroidales bacterium]|jgi:hypothetical protein|nr:DUF4160 domain-containing protein [Bacteroidales bacterium]
MPTIFEIFGLRFFFFSGDHAPIHIHVVKGDNDAKIAIMPEIKLVYNNGLKVGDLKKALQLAEMYKLEIIEAWNKYFDENGNN